MLLKLKIKQHYCKHSKLKYLREYIDNINICKVYVYKCDDCGKTVKRLIKV